MWDDGYVLLRDIELQQDRLRRVALERQARIGRDSASFYEAKLPPRGSTVPPARRGLRWWLHWLRWKQL